jgi:hypothetical protein
MKKFVGLAIAFTVSFTTPVVGHQSSTQSTSTSQVNIPNVDGNFSINIEETSDYAIESCVCKGSIICDKQGCFCNVPMTCKKV